MEPVRRSTVVVNNTTIINKTVINEAPATAAIEKASGRKVQAVPVQELRHKEEAAVVAKQRTPASTSEKKVQTPVRSEAQPSEKKAVAAPVTQVQKPAPRHARSQVQKAIIPRRLKNQPGRMPINNLQNRESLSSRRTKAQQIPKPPAKEKPAASDNNGPNLADKGHDNKPKNSCVGTGKGTKDSPGT